MKFHQIFIVFIISILITFGMLKIVHADTSESIPSSAVDAGVAVSSGAIDSDNANISALQSKISQDQSYINNTTTSIQNEQSQLASLQAQVLQIQQNITLLATQNPPIQSAVDLLNSNPNYGACTSSSTSCTQNFNCCSNSCLNGTCQ